MNAPYLRGAIYEIFQRNARQIELRKPSSLNFGGHSQARRINHKTVTFCNSQEATKQEHNSAKPVILSLSLRSKCLRGSVLLPKSLESRLVLVVG